MNMSYIAMQFSEAFAKLQRAKAIEIEAIMQAHSAEIEDYANENRDKNGVPECNQAEEMSIEEWRALRRAKMKERTNGSLGNG